MLQCVTSPVPCLEEMGEYLEPKMDEWLAADDASCVGGMDQIRLALPCEFAENGTISREQVNLFKGVHQRLIDAGLME